MSLLSKLNENRTTMFEKDQMEIEKEVQHMIKTFEDNFRISSIPRINIYPYDKKNEVFFPQSIQRFGKYLKKREAEIFHIVYCDKTAKTAIHYIVLSHDHCTSIAIDNRPAEMIARDIGYLFKQKTSDIFSLQKNQHVVINIADFVYYGYDDTRYGPATISKKALYFIKDSVEKHIGTFYPALENSTQLKWDDDHFKKYTRFFGLLFVIDSPTPRKRKSPY